MKPPILLVEDNSSDEKLTLLAFRQHAYGHDVVVLRDGADALDYLFASGPYADRDPAELPAMVLLDLKLPRIGGLEVLRRIRAAERTRFLPVVVLTASREERDVVRSYQLGANAYVRKPLDFTDFVEAARAIGTFWLLLNEPATGQRGAP
ncbi:MAG: response regulator [Deltaproteobacteria bacterium]|nr:response regulator [Myxococcales bacterium]MDP3220469.1 response regulator [Deltaproteobacteria bacterium]